MKIRKHINNKKLNYRYKSCNIFVQYADTLKHAPSPYVLGANCAGLSWVPQNLRRAAAQPLEHSEADLLWEYIVIGDMIGSCYQTCVGSLTTFRVASDFICAFIAFSLFCVFFLRLHYVYDCIIIIIIIGRV